MELGDAGYMATNRRWNWLALLGALIVCLPCLAGPLLALGVAAALSGMTGLLTDQSFLLAAGAMLALAPIGALLVRRRRRPVARCPQLAPDSDAPRTEPVEAQT